MSPGGGWSPGDVPPPSVDNPGNGPFKKCLDDYDGAPPWAPPCSGGVGPGWVSPSTGTPGIPSRPTKFNCSSCRANIDKDACTGQQDLPTNCPERCPGPKGGEPAPSSTPKMSRSCGDCEKCGRGGGDTRPGDPAPRQDNDGSPPWVAPPVSTFGGCYQECDCQQIVSPSPFIPPSYGPSTEPTGPHTPVPPDFPYKPGDCICNDPNNPIGRKCCTNACGDCINNDYSPTSPEANCQREIYASICYGKPFSAGGGFTIPKDDIPSECLKNPGAPSCSCQRCICSPDADPDSSPCKGGGESCKEYSMIPCGCNQAPGCAANCNDGRNSDSGQFGEPDPCCPPVTYVSPATKAQCVIAVGDFSCAGPFECCPPGAPPSCAEQNRDKADDCPVKGSPMPMPFRSGGSWSEPGPRTRTFIDNQIFNNIPSMEESTLHEVKCVKIPTGKHTSITSYVTCTGGPDDPCAKYEECGD